jgi:hypothetical protein
MRWLVRWRSILVLVTLLLTMGAAMAQQAQQAQQARPASAPAVNAGHQSSADPSSVLNAAFQVVQLVDADRTAELWDGASAVIKRLMQKQTFVDGVTKSRKRYGAAQKRVWMAVRRQRLAGSPTVPAGDYVSVELIAQVAGGKSLRELVTFRQDEDGVLRFSGYVLE